MSDLNNRKDAPQDQVRTLGVKGPMLMSGWGFDIAGMPTPNDYATNSDLSFADDAAENRFKWKTGPVALMWDDERQVWTGCLQDIEGVLTQPLTKASATTGVPGSGVMKVYRKTQDKPQGLKATYSIDGESVTEYVTLINRDVNLEVGVTGVTPVYVMAKRINYEWRPIYVSCPRASGAGQSGYDMGANYG